MARATSKRWIINGDFKAFFLVWDSFNTLLCLRKTTVIKVSCLHIIVIVTTLFYCNVHVNDIRYSYDCQASYIDDCYHSHVLCTGTTPITWDILCLDYLYILMMMMM